MERDPSYYDRLRRKEWREAATIGPSALSRYRIIMRLVKEFQFKDGLLDIGSGTGTLMAKLIDLSGFKEVLGSDFSEEAVKLGREKGLEVFRADIIKLSDFKDRRFNSVICSEVLEHIEDDAKALSNICQLIEKGGKVLITVPYSMEYWSIHDEFSGHVRRYGAKELADKVESSGFIILNLFIWGAVFFSIYYNILVKTSPSRVMNLDNHTKSCKKILGRILYHLFMLDDLMEWSKRGRRIFLVAQKR